jgi:hypothetical protein
MRSALALLFAFGVVAIAADGCSPHELGPSFQPQADGGAGPPLVPGVPAFTVKTVAPFSSLATERPTSATWAVYRKEDGSWAKLAESSPGTYVFQTKADRWAVVFACVDEDNTLVAMHEDAAAVTSYQVDLERWCAAMVPDPFTLNGTLLHLAPDTGWLDFGYALETRGVVLPLDGFDGRSATYEEVNVAAGTWDLAFGVRPVAGAPYSKIAIVRGFSLRADGKLDVDLAGASAVTPGTQRLVLRGVDASKETVAAPVYYTTSGGGLRGIDLGPDNIPTKPDPELTYATIPSPLADDRYRIEASATTSDGAVKRTIEATFHDAAPVDLAFSEALPAPTVAGAVLLTATTSARASAATYTMTVLAQINNRSAHQWRSSRGAALATGDVTLALPDLASAEGFDPAWRVSETLTREVTVTVRDKPTQLGDGTVVRAAAFVTTLPVP